MKRKLEWDGLVWRKQDRVEGGVCLLMDDDGVPTRTGRWNVEVMQGTLRRDCQEIPAGTSADLYVQARDRWVASDDTRVAVSRIPQPVWTTNRAAAAATALPVLCALSEKDDHPVRYVQDREAASTWVKCGKVLQVPNMRMYLGTRNIGPKPEDLDEVDLELHAGHSPSTVRVRTKLGFVCWAPRLQLCNGDAVLWSKDDSTGQLLWLLRGMGWLRRGEEELYTLVRCPGEATPIHEFKQLKAEVQEVTGLFCLRSLAGECLAFVTERPPTSAPETVVEIEWSTCVGRRLHGPQMFPNMRCAGSLVALNATRPCSSALAVPVMRPRVGVAYGMLFGELSLATRGTRLVLVPLTCGQEQWEPVLVTSCDCDGLSLLVGGTALKATWWFFGHKTPFEQRRADRNGAGNVLGELESDLLCVTHTSGKMICVPKKDFASPQIPISFPFLSATWLVPKHTPVPRANNVTQGGYSSVAVVPRSVYLDLRASATELNQRSNSLTKVLARLLLLPPSTHSVAARAVLASSLQRNRVSGTRLAHLASILEIRPFPDAQIVSHKQC